MEPQHPRPSRPHHHPHILNLLPGAAVSAPASPQPAAAATTRAVTATGLTPASSPGVFTPANSASPNTSNMASTASAPASGPASASASAPVSASASATGSASASAAASPVPDSANNPAPPGPSHTNSYLLPHQPVRETHIANVDRDNAGRKTINEYQVLEEIGRGQHGKVKLARDNMDGRMVAIKIIPRLSKIRRLGKASANNTQQNTKREIAILKKIRHENVVALLEVIDDPELQKIYMVLEYVERGEVTWRKKGLPNICYFERYRFEKGMHGQDLAPGECNWHAVLERKAAIRALKDARAAGLAPLVNQWTTEFGLTADVDDDGQPPWWYVPSAGLGPDAGVDSRSVSRAPSRVPSAASVSSVPTARSYVSDAPSLSVLAHDGDGAAAGADALDFLHPAPYGSATILDGSMYGAYADNPVRARQRAPSVADSIMSHLSGLDFNSMVHDPYADDFSYVPCFSIEQARSAFRDTVLGLEYLHYHGVVHRDIKPANLLWTKSYRVKISDFGVSYFGRPIRDGEPDAAVTEAEALDFDDDRELSKTVGTPAFFAPELCYTDIDTEPPRVSEQIDVWSLGVTLYCLLFARIPFLAEDEYSMFRKIATEEPYISNRRLKPVGVYTDPTGSSLYQRINVHPYRSDADPEYEELSESLIDLLRRMLIKNPERRIRLRDVKRHPWVTEDIKDVAAWIENTDPARTPDHRIHVDEAEIGGAIVPLNFLQRARSAVKRAVDKVIHPRSERDESATAPLSRNRASSSAASSVADYPLPSQPGGGMTGLSSAAMAQHNHNNGVDGGGNHDYGSYSGQGFSNPFGSHHNHHHSVHHHTSAHPRDARRKSLRGGTADDYFATVTQMPPPPLPQPEHPLSQSVTASPYASPSESTPGSEDLPRTAQSLMSAGDPSARLQPGTPDALFASSNLDGSADASASSNSGLHPRPLMTRHAHSRSISNAILSRASILRDLHANSPPTTPPPATVVDHSVFSTVRRTREVRSTTDPNARTRSVDRAGIVFANPDKRAGPVVDVSTASASGSVVQQGRHAHYASPSASSCLAHAVSEATSNETGGSDETVNAGSTGNASVEGYFGDSSSPADKTRTLSPTSTPSFPQQRFTAAALSSYQNTQQIPDYRRRPVAAHMDERPATAHRVIHEGVVLADDDAPPDEHQQQQQQQPSGCRLGFVDIPCPPSPMSSAAPGVGSRHGSQSDTNLDGPAPQAAVAAAVTPTATSSSSVSLEGFSQTPLTSPSEMTHYSFVAGQPGHRKGSSNAMMTFQSDPSLPALLSGASSVSADMEGDFLGGPGVVGGLGGSPSLAEAAAAANESRTPPAALEAALDKEAGVGGFPLMDPATADQGGLRDQQGWASGGAIPVTFDSQQQQQQQQQAASTAASAGTASRGPSPLPATPVRRHTNRSFVEEDEDSDSDGGIIMMTKAKKRGGGFSRDVSRDVTPLVHGGRSQAMPAATTAAASAAGTPTTKSTARRRDTNTSVGSTDTAKKVSVSSSESEALAGQPQQPQPQPQP